MARVRHQGPEFSVIDENIGDKIVKEDDVRGFMAHIKEPELALLKKFDADNMCQNTLIKGGGGK